MPRKPRSYRLSPIQQKPYLLAIQDGMPKWIFEPGRVDYMWSLPEMKANPELQQKFKEAYRQHSGKPFVPPTPTAAKAKQKPVGLKPIVRKG